MHQRHYVHEMERSEFSSLSLLQQGPGSGSLGMGLSSSKAGVKEVMPPN